MKRYSSAAFFILPNTVAVSLLLNSFGVSFSGSTSSLGASTFGFALPPILLSPTFALGVSCSLRPSVLVGSPILPSVPIFFAGSWPIGVAFSIGLFCSLIGSSGEKNSRLLPFKLTPCFLDAGVSK